MQSFIPDLAKLGYVWQFITLAGFHGNSLIYQGFCEARNVGVRTEDTEAREGTWDRLLPIKSGRVRTILTISLKTMQGGFSTTALMDKGILF
ncbi:hypothetical protein [Enterobacter cloacae complex sp. 4DZ1-17B1]|uniref:hypothetical protein n=1 Tax=Enterobacter cloacae complex sp. 4DZ1-17B1 TaxID=2511991 RepID=UPI0013EA9058